jgi:hypothetical protein
MMQMKVIEENGQTTAARDEGACDCGCGCGMGATHQPSTEARQEAQPVAADKGLHRRLLAEPYGCCEMRRFS